MLQYASSSFWYTICHQLDVLQLEPHCVKVHGDAHAADLLFVSVGGMPTHHDAAAVRLLCSMTHPAVLCNTMQQ